MKETKHDHYFKPCPYETLDVYRVISIFGVTDPCIQHALKKLLCSGVRGHKDQEKDIQDVIDTLERWKQMREEDAEATSSGELSPKVDLPKVSEADADIDRPDKKWYPDDSGEWVETCNCDFQSTKSLLTGRYIEVLANHERNGQSYTQVVRSFESWFAWYNDWGNRVAYKVVK